MNTGKTIFSQVMEFLPLYEFRKCVQRYQGDYKARSFSCLDQFLCMAFAQLTYRESLRDIESCLRFMRTKLYHMGFRGSISKSTLADANNQRDWHIYADLAQVLIHRARKLYLNEPFGVELKQAVYALDATTIDLCLSLFPWAHFRQSKAAVKLHTLLDLRGSIILHYGQRLSGFCSSLHAASKEDILHRAHQIKYSIQKALFPSYRQVNRPALRSNNSLNRLSISQRLSGKTPADQILRCRAQSAADIFNQSLYARCHQYCSALQMPLEDRTIFQMDQTTLKNKIILWDKSKRCKNTNLDCRFCLSPCSDCKEKIEIRVITLHFSTDFKCVDF